ncbi:uncharacterized protein LOC126800032 [Argentina anserina]|uniref:uncharacterized protein LOC126800032 n=1 Tax=Argentina anserina TaxID=57926 RepID=UPI002176528F|nr:uncharacterized protein LOC126800032 [Potentilla anserina]
MDGPSNLRTLPPLQVFSTVTPPQSSSSFSSMTKLKTLIRTLIISHVCRAIRYLNKAKSKTISFFVLVVKVSQPMQLIYPTKNSKNKKKNKIFFGSFRLHYNWCSSTHVLPVPARVYDGLTSTSHLYYDSNWNSIVSTEEQCGGHGHQVSGESQLSGYLQWLEENKVNEKSMETETDENEIDKLADLFIASCHEKFMLEKQESYRRFQEMLARSA